MIDSQVVGLYLLLTTTTTTTQTWLKNFALVFQ